MCHRRAALRRLLIRSALDAPPIASTRIFARDLVAQGGFEHPDFDVMSVVRWTASLPRKLVCPFGRIELVLYH